jgi:hypothetical protein
VLTGNNQFEIELKKRIAEEIERVKSILATATAIKTFDDFRYYAGRLHGLRDVAEHYCDEVATIMNER